MNTEALQSIVNRFNREYVKACNTSNPEDWGEAALIGRQIVNALADLKYVDDNYQAIVEQLKRGEIT